LQNELAQHRKDAAQAQQKHSKWQESLREKLTGFREEKLNWQNEAASIRTDRSNLETTALRQKAELAQVKNEYVYTFTGSCRADVQTFQATKSIGGGASESTTY
jgi:hypothetical protein